MIRLLRLDAQLVQTPPTLSVYGEERVVRREKVGERKGEKKREKIVIEEEEEIETKMMTVQRITFLQGIAVQDHVLTPVNVRTERRGITVVEDIGLTASVKKEVHTDGHVPVPHADAHVPIPHADVPVPHAGLLTVADVLDPGQSLRTQRATERKESGLDIKTVAAVATPVAQMQVMERRRNLMMPLSGARQLKRQRERTCLGSPN